MTVSGVRHVAHTGVRPLAPRRLLFHTEPIVPRHIGPFPFHSRSGPSRARRGLPAPAVTNAEWQADTDQSCSWKPSCHSGEASKEETISGKTRAVWPALDRGQISRITRLGWTLLASSHTTTTLCSGPPPLPDYLIALYKPVAWCHCTAVSWNHEGRRGLVNRLGMKRLSGLLPIIVQPITAL